MTAEHLSGQEHGPLAERFYQFLLIISFIAFCWLALMVVHEFGHVIAAWLTGGKVAKVVLRPLQISWTAFSYNPHPLPVAWGGPVFVFGILCVPAGLWLWQGQGTHFGLGTGQGRVHHPHPLFSMALLILLVGMELLFAK